MSWLIQKFIWWWYYDKWSNWIRNRTKFFWPNFDYFD